MADKNPGFFDSDEEDDDFVPQDESDDAIEPDDEEQTNTNAPSTLKKGKKNTKKNTSRRRKGGLYLSDEEPAEDNESTNMEPKDDTQDPTSTDGKSDLQPTIDNNTNNNNNPLTTSNPDPSPANDANMNENPTNAATENAKKRKLDDLWAEMNKPVAKKKAPPKTVLPWAFAPTAPKTNGATTSNNSNNTTVTSIDGVISTTEKKEVTINANEILGLSTSEEKKVTITQTFNFAGEEVKVTKEVDAKDVPIVKGSKGLESVLSKIKGQKKMTSTQKSALDWNQFKEKEGIEQELQHAAKDGYLEKVAFMERTDLRQFEKEKELRDEVRKINSKKK
eukprot:TRINITY_DN2030_c0_g1_i1.p1 TRINITY_DN2030_c0_g1~~TRINITY_DN2030_c0_g1_i1.p1  ORF type:complete len:357 (+),score=103.21 TRINITY_DN2030_c0_g1_i1:68-1072(+)